MSDPGAETAQGVYRICGADAFAPPPSPIVVSVPHAGRAYPSGLIAQARVPASVLCRLEDRHADALATRLIAAGHQVLIADAPRALIDLNRDPREIDMTMVHGMPHGWPTVASAKLRGGLGLVPRRLQGVGELWLAPLAWSDVSARIDAVHSRYHDALADMMRRARDAHGFAILLDLHSMPPLPASVDGAPRPHIVLGDRFGRSASLRLMELAADLCAGRGFATARNHPYPGHYLIARHGRPAHGFHALQIEVDRSLYLDAALDDIGPGLDVVQALLVDMAWLLADELPDADFTMAAE